MKVSENLKDLDSAMGNLEVVASKAHVAIKKLAQDYFEYDSKRQEDATFIIYYHAEAELMNLIAMDYILEILKHIKEAAKLVDSEFDAVRKSN